MKRIRIFGDVAGESKWKWKPMELRTVSDTKEIEKIQDQYQRQLIEKGVRFTTNEQGEMISRNTKH